MVIDLNEQIERAISDLILGKVKEVKLNLVKTEGPEGTNAHWELENQEVKDFFE